MDISRLWPSCLALLAVSIAPAARANGAFPAVSQLVADPSRSNHLLLRSNFGLLTSSDRGDNWDLVCEGGIGYQNIEPAIAVLDDGTTIAALPQGIAYGDAAECNFRIAAGVASYVADVARVPGAPGQAVAVSVDVNHNQSQIWSTTDGGKSWYAASDLLLDLNAATLDVAGDDPQTLYVSGVSGSAGVSGVLSRSSDAGQTWARFAVPGVSKLSAPYIAAVADSKTVYVRLSGSPGHLLVTRDAGQHFESLLDFAGPLDGFALSPDGQLALASGRIDGVWRAPTSSLAFERLSCAKLRCLSWSQAGLFACANDFEAGFLVGESVDQGQSFAPRLHLSCVRGLLACASTSSVGSLCPAAWPAISEQLGTDCAAAQAFTASTSCSAVTGGSPAVVGGASDAGPMAAAKSGNLRARGGCSMTRPSGALNAWPSVLSLSGLLLLGRRRVGKHGVQLANPSR